MTGFVLCDEYYENPIFSEDPEKNLIMWRVFEEEYALLQEYRILDAYEWGEAPIPDDEILTYSSTGDVCYAHDQLRHWFDGTGITWEEYELAKKNLS